MEVSHIVRTKDDEITVHCIGMLEGEIVSTAKMTVMNEIVYLSELYVHSEHRSKGYGTIMQEYRENLAKTKFQKEKAYLSCKQFTPRHKRYLKRGYRVAISGYKNGSDYLIKNL